MRNKSCSWVKTQVLISSTISRMRWSVFSMRYLKTAQSIWKTKYRFPKSFKTNHVSESLFMDDKFRPWSYLSGADLVTPQRDPRQAESPNHVMILICGVCQDINSRRPRVISWWWASSCSQRCWFGNYWLTGGAGCRVDLSPLAMDYCKAGIHRAELFP